MRELPRLVDAFRYSIRLSALAMTGVIIAGTTVSVLSKTQGLSAVQLGLSAISILTWWLAWRTADAASSVRIACLALLFSILTPLARTDSPEDRLSISTWVFVFAYLLIIGGGRRFAYLSVLFSTGLLLLVFPSGGYPFTLGSFTLTTHQLVTGQLIVSGLWLIQVWGRITNQVRLRDAAQSAAQSGLQSAIESQTRTQTWRQALARTHETVLNDLRSALDNPQADLRALAAQIRNRPALELELATTPSTLMDLVAAVRNSLADDIEVAIAVDGGAISPELAEPLRAVLTELGRNAVRHAAASRLRLEAAAVRGGFRFRVSHNGQPPTAASQSGIGRDRVIDESLAAINAQLQLREQEFVIEVAAPKSSADTLGLVNTDFARTGVAAIAIGNSVGAVPMFLLAIPGWEIPTPLWLASMSVIVAGTISTLRSRAFPISALILISAVASATPFLAAAELHKCTVSEPSIFAVVLTGFALVATLIWSRNPSVFGLAIVWQIAALWLIQQVPPVCYNELVPHLNAAVAPMLFFAIVLYGARRSAQRAAGLTELQMQQVIESSAAQASYDFALELKDAIDEAQNTLLAAGDHNGLTDADRIRLRCLDSQIRAAMQVDPVTAGRFSLLGRSLVEASLRKSAPTRVLSLRDSGDRTPLDPVVAELLNQLVEATHDDQNSIQVLTDGANDNLVFTCSAQTAEAAGLSSAWEHKFDRGQAYTESAGSRVMIFVERAVQH